MKFPMSIQSPLRHLIFGGTLALTGHIALGYAVVVKTHNPKALNLGPVVMVDLIAPEAVMASDLSEAQHEGEPIEPDVAEIEPPIPQPPVPQDLIPQPPLREVAELSKPQAVYDVPSPPDIAQIDPVVLPTPLEPVQEPLAMSLDTSEPLTPDNIKAALPNEESELQPEQVEPASQALHLAKATLSATRAVSLKPSTDRSRLESAQARTQKANYFGDISRHLNRRKKYPKEARKARQVGVVKVRFTVDRNGMVSNVSIKESSGHALLDQETIALLKRVAPLPPMPQSVKRDSLTVTLPIEYSLRTR